MDYVLVEYEVLSRGEKHESKKCIMKIEEKKISMKKSGC